MDIEEITSEGVDWIPLVQGGVHKKSEAAIV
jgi:hypothetical protein